MEPAEKLAQLGLAAPEEEDVPRVDGREILPGVLVEAHPEVEAVLDVDHLVGVGCRGLGLVVRVRGVELAASKRGARRVDGGGGHRAEHPRLEGRPHEEDCQDGYDREHEPHPASEEGLLLLRGVGRDEPGVRGGSGRLRRQGRGRGRHARVEMRGRDVRLRHAEG